MYRLKRKLRNLSHNSKFFDSLYSSANRCKISLLSHLSDELHAKIYYKENTGERLCLENPTTYNEKLWWLKLNNRDPLLTICSDKYRVRDYVNEAGLGHLLPRLYGVYLDAEEINFDELPDKVFLKTNHGSGTNVLFDRHKPFDVDGFRRKFNRELRRNYYYQSREWNYKNIEPRIIAEQVLENPNAPLVEYRVMCFEGKARLIFVQLESATEEGVKNPWLKRNIYDVDYQLLPVRFGHEGFDPELVPRSSNWENMIKYAEKLSQPFPHCRVDFYDLDDRLYLGELTFYHGGGAQEVTPRVWAEKIGSWIDLSSDKIVRVD